MEDIRHPFLLVMMTDTDGEVLSVGGIVFARTKEEALEEGIRSAGLDPRTRVVTSNCWLVPAKTILAFVDYVQELDI